MDEELQKIVDKKLQAALGKPFTREINEEAYKRLQEYDMTNPTHCAICHKEVSVPYKISEFKIGFPHEEKDDYDGAYLSKSRPLYGPLKIAICTECQTEHKKKYKRYSKRENVIMFYNIIFMLPALFGLVSCFIAYFNDEDFIAYIPYIALIIISFFLMLTVSSKLEKGMVYVSSLIEEQWCRNYRQELIQKYAEFKIGNGSDPECYDLNEIHITT